MRSVSLDKHTPKPSFAMFEIICCKKVNPLPFIGQLGILNILDTKKNNIYLYYIIDYIALNELFTGCDLPQGKIRMTLGI
jgi:hypothetical protein